MSSFVDTADETALDNAALSASLQLVGTQAAYPVITVQVVLHYQAKKSSWLNA